MCQGIIGGRGFWLAVTGPLTGAPKSGFASKAIGEVPYVLDSIAQVEKPSNSGAAKYVKLTASDPFNNNLIATGVISVAISPMNGVPIYLENTIPNNVMGDAIRNIKGSINWLTPSNPSSGTEGLGVFKEINLVTIARAGGVPSSGYRMDFDAAHVVPVDVENRPRYCLHESFIMTNFIYTDGDKISQEKFDGAIKVSGDCDFYLHAKPSGEKTAFENGQLVIVAPDEPEPPPEPLPPTADDVCPQIRAMLAQPDWLIVREYEIGVSAPDDVKAYRAALRAVTDQAGFPADIDWPELQMEMPQE